tara:strand:- start:3185 stop:4066 length:882 start_codon:yes stop_codon:yes gene_type:complete
MDYISVDRIFAKFYRDLKNTDLNESDVIEWIGESLEFLKVREIQEQAVIFLEVSNHEAIVPKGLQTVLQIARNNYWTEDVQSGLIEVSSSLESASTVESSSVTLNCNYNSWVSNNYYQREFTPVRLANNVFFKSLVCKEKTPYINSNGDEYTIVGDYSKKFRFSFETGMIALSYTKSKIDDETGYPLIPDNISYISAITYYIKWKLAERYVWDGREGFMTIANESEQRWLKYARQGKNFMKMPKSIDDYQDMLEESHHLIPKQKRYYNYFGNLGTSEDRRFNDPEQRNTNLRL